MGNYSKKVKIKVLMTNTEIKLRTKLWLNHGYSKGMGNLYGDDGEMQCHKCGNDFLRQSLHCIAENIDNPHPGNFFKEKEEKDET